MGELSDRRSFSAEQIAKLREGLAAADQLAAGKACVYATGSFGRAEASKHSDLDLFIASKADGRSQVAGKNPGLLKRLDEICIKADLIELTRDLGLPEFSGDGRYLTSFSVQDLIRTLGRPEDDATNTFTARLLLLLESTPLVGDDVYSEITKEVIAAYWIYYKDHKNEFMPAYLANDILRLWRTFCVNYESIREVVPDERKAKGKLQNYKLKHSRLLTCYSALLYLLATFQQKGTVAPSDAVDMISLTPVGRLEWLKQRSDLEHARSLSEDLLEHYERFLVATNRPQEELIEAFMKKDSMKQYMNSAFRFGDLIYELLMKIGTDSKFHRLLVV